MNIIARFIPVSPLHIFPMHNEVRDFSNRKFFPGEIGNPFDVVLHKLDSIDRVPPFLFAAILFFLAFTSAGFSIGQTLIYWAFMYCDWVLLAILPRIHRSFGPPQPPAFILSLCRLIIGLLPFPIALILLSLGTIAVFYGFYFEPFRLGVTIQTFTSSKLHLNDRIRLVHIGDLHIERITKRELKLIALIKKLDLDLILFSGDILNLSYLHDPIAHRDAISVLSQLTARSGVYYVSGSPAVDLPEVFQKLVSQLPGDWLDNQRKALEINGVNVEILGITCTHRPHEDEIQLKRLLDTTNTLGFRILLYHTPDLAPQASQMGIDLQLSGHTHGGQVRLPFFGALFAGSLYGKRFEAGRYQLGNMILYVTRGIGMEGAAAPRVRFLCPPEIILWEIHGTSNN